MWAEGRDVFLCQWYFCGSDGGKGWKDKGNPEERAKLDSGTPAHRKSECTMDLREWGENEEGQEEGGPEKRGEGETGHGGGGKMEAKRRKLGL